MQPGEQQAPCMQEEQRGQHSREHVTAHGSQPAVGMTVDLQMRYMGSQLWRGVICEAHPPGCYTVVFDDCIYRKVVIDSQGTWRPVGPWGVATAPTPVIPDEAALINKDIRVWLDGTGAQPTTAEVVAYNPLTREHTLRYGGCSHNHNLQRFSWEHLAMTYSPTPPGQAAPGSTAAAADAAAAEEPLQGQQRKRKQQQASARSVRARPGQQQADPAGTTAEPGSAAAAALPAAAPVAATAGAGSSAGGRCAPRGSRCRDADAHSASSPTAEPGSDASKAQQRGSSRPAAGDAAADAAVVIMRAAAEPAKPGGAATVPAAGQEGCARPQRSKQPSKRLLLPGERLSDGDDADALHHRTASSKPPSRLQHVSTAPTAAAAGAAAAPRSAQAEWPTDAQLLQAVAAAHAARLPAGQGQVCWSVPGTAESLVGVQLQDFVLGNPISCHLGVQQVQGAAGQARLFQQVVGSGGQPSLHQLSQPCHDCGHTHVPRLCQQPGCDISSSVCNRCLLKRYHTLYRLPELLECCPGCRKACACNSCLRDSTAAELVPPPQLEPLQQTRQAQYVLHELLPHLASMLQAQQAEVACWGYGSLQAVPQSPLDVEVRPLCDRCATQIAGVAAHCEQCGWDVCCECAAALRQQVEAVVAAAAADVALQVTCCNPQCGRQGGLSAQSEQSPMPPYVASQQQDGITVDAGQLGAGGSAALDHVQGAAGAQDGAADDGEGERAAEEAAEQVAVVRQQLFSLRDNPPLELQLVLPPDLLADLGELLKLSGKAATSQQQLLLQHCPFLDSQDMQLLQSSPPTVPGTSQPLTLQHLQSPVWWQHMPQELRDAWRRSAAVPGCPAAVDSSSDDPGSSMAAGPGAAQHPEAAAAAAAAAAGAQSACSSSASGGFLFTPHVAQLQQEGPVGLLARLVFWARWRLGEPIVVRGVKGTIPWDPHTLERAMGSSAGDAAGTFSVLDCQDFSEVVVSHSAFFSGYLKGHFAMDECEDGQAQTPLQLPQQQQQQPPLQKQYQQQQLQPPKPPPPQQQQQQRRPVMYKLKDWPPSSDIREKLCRHYADFLAALPVRCYTEPRLGGSALNVATALTPRDNPTDLGPKCYIAYGRVAEAQGEGDSVTKVHNDMTDAINLLLDTAPGGDPDAQQLAQQQQLEQQEHHQQQQQLEAGPPGAAAAPAPGAPRQQQARCGDQQAQLPGYQGAGAVWDIWSRGSLQHLNAYLATDAARFVHRGQPVLEGGDPLVTHAPVFSQAYMLSQTHRQAFMAFVQQQTQQDQQQPGGGGVCLWHFEQYDGEAVFIPGGCAHQVRNLKSCCKAAADFVSPESMGQALLQKALLRDADLRVPQPLDEGPHDRHCQEKLQSQLILMRGVLRAARTLQAQQQ